MLARLALAHVLFPNYFPPRHTACPLPITASHSDGRGQKVPMLPFMVGTAFLTNVFYLPYLGLRSPSSAVESVGDYSDNDRKAIQVGESRALPVLLVAVFAGLLYVCGLGLHMCLGLGPVSTWGRLFRSLPCPCISLWYTPVQRSHGRPLRTGPLEVS